MILSVFLGLSWVSVMCQVSTFWSIYQPNRHFQGIYFTLSNGDPQCLWHETLHWGFRLSHWLLCTINAERYSSSILFSDGNGDLERLFAVFFSRFLGHTHTQPQLQWTDVVPTNTARSLPEWSNIATENGPFEDVFPIKDRDIPANCVSLPEGNSYCQVPTFLKIAPCLIQTTGVVRWTLQIYHWWVIGLRLSAQATCCWSLASWGNSPQDFWVVHVVMIKNQRLNV